MRQILYLACFFLIALSNETLSSQQIIYKTMPFLDNLSINSIFTLFQDKAGYIWVGTSDGLARYDGYSLKWISNNYNHQSVLSSNDIRCFTEDNDYIWIGTGHGITLVNKNNFQLSRLSDEKIQHVLVRDLLCDNKGNVWIGGEKNIYRCHTTYGVDKEYVLPFSLNSLFEDHDNRIWAVGTNGSVYYYDKTNDSFVSYSSLKDCNVYRMTQDKEGRYWLATWGDGIFRFNPNAESTSSIFKQQIVMNPTRKLPEEVFYDIIQDDTYGYIWALAHFQLYIFKINQNDNLEVVDSNTIQNNGLPIDLHKTYSKVIKDKTGSLWLGAFDQGLIVHFESNQIENYTLSSMRESIGLDPNIIYLNKDSNDIVWFNQARLGISLYNEKTNQISHNISNTDLLYNIDIRVIQPSLDGNTMWLGGRERDKGTIWRAREKNMSIYLLEKINLKKWAEDVGEILQIIENKDGYLYIATTNYLFSYSLQDKTVIKVPHHSDNIVDLLKYDDDNLLICCSDKIDYYPIKKVLGKEKNLSLSMQEYLLVGETFKSCILQSDRILWISTDFGRIIRVDISSKSVEDYTSKFGLKGDNILKIVADKQNWIYVIFSKYILKLNINAPRQYYIYSVNDPNVFVSSFRYGAAFIDNEGHLYAGGHRGFIKIKNDYSKREKKMPKICITDVKVSNKSIFFSNDSLKHCNTNKKVNIYPNESNIEIQFSSFQYKTPQKVKYAYQLEGVDTDWNIIENGKNTAFYNQLNKGIYTFRVKSTDSDGRWLNNESRLTVIRHPAWFETWEAYCIYSIITILLVTMIVKFYLKTLQRKNKSRLQEELSQIKIGYFTNISHELLTPLTIISCTIDYLRNNATIEKQILETLQNNAASLKRLIQQILDFRKVETGSMKLNIEYANISRKIESIVACNFQPLAHAKGVRLTCDIEKDIFGYIDQDILDKILSNILSNAIKYTPQGKQIYMNVLTRISPNEKHVLHIDISDEGIGIEAHEIPKIFTKFYHNPNHHGYESNGIGLSLTKELLNLHHGLIKVYSKLNKGTTFSFEIPIGKIEYTQEENQDLNLTINEKDNTVFLQDTSDNDIQPNPLSSTILFVDDNIDLLKLMTSLFCKRYHVLIAASGKEGLSLLSIHDVDVIICDLMMPEMNGLQFCECVKQNPQTEFISIIMLTASHNPNDHAQGYLKGVDSYLTKPFDMSVLEARIENLLEACKTRKEAFQTDTEIDIQKLNYQSEGEEFIQNAIKCIEANMQEPDFDVEQMASSMCMSRSTLSRRLKALTGLTPLDFIRNIKLKYACSLLKKQLSITEVAYSTGFSSPRYFSKCFKESFGLTPSEYQDNNHTPKE